MKTKIISVIALMLVAVFIFASCSKKKYKYYVDNNGETYIAYTNENGETVTNINGAPIVIPTDRFGDPVEDSYGKPQTRVADPGYRLSSNGKKVETSGYVLTVPDGWVINTGIEDYVQLRLGDIDSKTSIDIHFNTDGYDAAISDFEPLHKNFADNIENLIESDKKETKLKDGEISPVTLFSFMGSHTNEDKTVTVGGYREYIFDVNGYTYSIFCASQSEDEFKNTDFVSVIESIEYK